MDVGTYHLEKDDKIINEIQNLTECSLIREEPRMIPEDKFDEHKNLEIPEIHAKTINEESRANIVVSVASLNTPTYDDDDKHEFQQFEIDSQFNKGTTEEQKGRAKLIRLQAVSSGTNEADSNENSLTQSNEIKISSGDLNNQTYESDTVNTVPQFYCPEDNYQFLAPPEAATELPDYVSTNKETNIQSNNINTGSDLIQRAFSSMSDNSTIDYQQIMLDVHNSEISMNKQDKMTDTLPSSAKGSTWSINSHKSANDSTDGSSGSSILYQASGNETTDESNDLQNLETVNDISQAQPMQRFITADNEVVYGYKDSSGEFHFFSPTINDRESHNEKERKRRSRVSEACGALRRMIPGVSEKTDKATVFEQAARYLKFLREKFGVQFDQVYYDKFYQERS